MKTSGYTAYGGRKYNEDFYDIVNKGEQCCLILADGLGGHGGGNIASKTAAEQVRESFLAGSGAVTREDMDTWFDKANRCIVTKQTTMCQMKTTLVVLCIDKSAKTAVWEHLGDSRLYHFVDGQYVFCTFDHSVSRMAVLRGEITIDELRFHADRSKLLKVVGKEDMARPEYGACELAENQKHAFLLCTDGFWEYVTEDQMEQMLQTARTPEEWLVSMREELEKNVDGTNDNHTAVAVFI